MGKPVDTTYPHELEQTIVLTDGTRVQSRPIRPDDATRLIDLYARLTPTTAYQRFFSARRQLPAEWAHRLANVDYDRRLALVAEPEIGGARELIAVARYEPTDEADAAEVAVVVQDSWQGKGLGPRLLGDLLAAAEARGIRRFRADVLADNGRMLRLITRLANVERQTIDSGVVTVDFRRREDGWELASPAGVGRRDCA